MPEVIEQGELYFLYRNKVGTERAESLEDVQRFYLVLVPERRSEIAQLGLKAVLAGTLANLSSAAIAGMLIH